MHMLYVFPEPLPLPRARGLQVAHFVRAIAMSGVKVTLAYVPGKGTHPFEPIGYDIPDGVTLLPLTRTLPGFPNERGPKSQRLFMYRLLQWIRSARKNRHLPDVVFFRHIKAAANFCAAKTGIPFVYEAHEVFAQTAKASKRAEIELLEKQVLTGAMLVLTNSDGSANGLQARYHFAAPVHVLPNGVDYPAELPEKSWAEIGSRIVYAGSMFGWKGVDDLVDAAGLLPEYKFTILGGSQEQIERLKNRVVTTNIRFTGHVPQYQVKALLAESCIAVLPNRPDPDSEFTSPLKLFEYMAAGCAVVATDLPALRAYLGESHAAWAEAINPSSLAEAIRGLCQSPERARALGAWGREAVRARTWQQRAMDMQQLIHQASGGRISLAE